MPSEDLLQALRRRPLIPFTLHGDELKSYYVPSPEFVAHKPGTGTAVVLHRDDSGFDRIALSHISQLSLADELIDA